MTKQALALQLRERQRTAGLLSAAELLTLKYMADDGVIDCYIKCPCCTDRQAKGERLRRIIAASTNACDFLDRCNQVDDRERRKRQDRLRTG